MNRQSSVVCYLTSVSFFGFLSSAVRPLSSVFMQNKPNSPIVQVNLTVFITMIYAISISLTKVKNKPNSNPISKSEKRPKEAKKKKSASGTFLRLWFAGKIDFLDGCDILLGKIYGKSQFNLFWRLIL